MLNPTAFIALFLISVGCSSGSQPSLRATPKHSIPVHVRADVILVDEATVLSWIDLRADEWIANKAAWGCEGFSDEHLVVLLQARPVVVFSGHYLPHQPWAMGWNTYDSPSPKIDVTLNWPALVLPSDLYNGAGIGIRQFDYSYGLRQLPHEWTHTARGDFHP